MTEKLEPISIETMNKSTSVKQPSKERGTSPAKSQLIIPNQPVKLNQLQKKKMNQSNLTQNSLLNQTIDTMQIEESRS